MGECKTCKYCHISIKEISYEDREIYQCRFNPKALDTDSDYWCGQYKQKEDEPTRR